MKHYVKPFIVLGFLAVLLSAPALPFSPASGFSAVYAAQTASGRIMQVIPLNQGEVTLTQYGDITVHAFRTGDPLTDECYALESKDGIVLIEATIMKADMDAWKGYLDSLGKPVAGAFMAYHPNGYERLGDVPILATAKALQNWQPGGGIYTISSGLSDAFKDTADSSLPTSVTQILKEGQTVKLAGIDINILASDDDAYSLEIPALHAVYRHMLGSHVHSILTSRDYIEAEIKEMKDYEKAGYTLVLTSHYIPECREAITTKRAYLEKALELSKSCPDMERFKAAMEQAFPNYEGEKYLGMSAQALYTAK